MAILAGLVLVATTLILVSVGWRDPRDVQPRNIIGATLVLLTPFLLPLAITILPWLQPGLDSLSWLFWGWFAAIALSLLGMSIHAHPMPNLGCVWILAIAWLLNVFGGFMVVAWSLGGA